MMDDQPWREEYHGSGVWITVRCGRGRCLVEVWLEQRLHPRAEHVKLDVLLQPRDQRGLPRGSPATLCDLQIPLRLRPNGESLGGHAWLPAEMGSALLSGYNGGLRLDKWEMSVVVIVPCGLNGVEQINAARRYSQSSP